MYKLPLIISIALLLLAAPQNTNVQKTELKNIAETLIGRDSVKPYYLLVDSIDHFKTKTKKLDGVRYTIASDEVVNAGLWTNEIFEKAHIISKNYLDSVVKANRRMEPPAHYRFSLPYFSSDKKSFIIYYNYYCGSLCAEYSLRLYKKVKGKWTFIKNFFLMVS